MTGDVDFGFCYPEAFQQTQDSLNRTLSGMAELRAKRVRILIPWSQTQTGRGKYNFAVTDAAVYSAVAHGLRPLLVYATFPTPPSAGSAADFGAWVGAFAAHYSDVASDHELWNEQNAFGFWPGPPAASAYAPFLRAGYTAIKAAQPASTVISGGMNPCGNGWLFTTLSVDPVDFLKGIYAAGGKGTFDAVGNHPYSIATSAGSTVAEMPSATENYIVKDQKIYDVMVANGDGAKQIWHTEYGFPRSVVGAQNQKDWLKIQFDILSARPYVGPTFFYSYHDLTADSKASESTFGCVDFNYVKQPSWDFYDSLTSQNPVVSGHGSLTVSAAIIGAGSVNGEYVPTAIATGTAQLHAAQEGHLAASVTIAGAGMVVSQTAFSYDFGSAPSTKPTSLFTDFGLGYRVASGVANANASTTGGENKSGGIYVTACAGPDHFSKVIVGPGGLSPDRSDLPIVRADGAGNNYVTAVGTAWQSQIVTVIGGVSAVQDSAQVGFSNGDELGIVADGDTYTVTKNGEPVPNLLWLDKDHVFPGYLNRHVGFGFQQRYTDRAYPAPGIRKWQAGDVRPVAPSTPPPIVMATITGTAAIAGHGSLTAAASVVGAGSPSGAPVVAGSLVGTVTAVGSGSVGVGASGVPVAVLATIIGAGVGSGVFANSAVVQIVATAAAAGSVGVRASGLLAVTAAAVGAAGQPVASGALSISATMAGAASVARLGNGTALAVTATATGAATVGVTGQAGSSTPVPVAYGATGSGSVDSAVSTTVTSTATHTIASGDTLVIVDVLLRHNGTFTSMSCTYGGAAMVGTGSQVVAGGNEYRVSSFALVNPPSGAQAVVATALFSVAATTGVIATGSVSYGGAGTPIAYVIAGGGAATTSNSVTVATIAANEFAHFAHFSSTAMTPVSYNQTQRLYSVPATGFYRLIGDAQGTGAPITSQVTQSSTSAWLALGSKIPSGVVPGAGVTATISGAATVGTTTGGDLPVTATATGTGLVTSTTVTTWDATGTGAQGTNGFSTSITATGSITTAAANELITATVTNYAGSGAPSVQTMTCTLDGVAMTLVASAPLGNNSTTTQTLVYWGIAAASGSHAIVARGAGSAQTGREIRVECEAFQGATQVTGYAVNYGTSTTPSVTVTGGNANERVYVGIGTNGGGTQTTASFTGGTGRSTGASSSGNADVLQGDCTGSSSVTAGSTINSSHGWTAIAVRLSS